MAAKIRKLWIIKQLRMANWTLKKKWDWQKNSCFRFRWNSCPFLV